MNKYSNHLASNLAGSDTSAQPVTDDLAPRVLETLTWLEGERYDMTLDEAFDVLRFSWKKIHGRTERQLILQIASLLATQTARQQGDEFKELSRILGQVADGVMGMEQANHCIAALMPGMKDVVCTALQSGISRLAPPAK